MIIIDDSNDLRIEKYKSLKKIRNDEAPYYENDLFVAEGEKVNLKLLQSDLKIHSMLCVDWFYENNKEIICNKIPEDKIFVADKRLLSEIVGYKIHSGIMSLAEEKRQCDLDELDDEIIALNSVIDTENIGSIVRNAAAFGFGSIILDKASASPYMRRAVRVSMGNIFDIKHRVSDNLIDDLLTLKRDYGFTLIAAELCEDAYPIGHFEFPKLYVLIFGAEGPGVSQEILDIVDYKVEIPINSAVKSINVAASSAVFMYDIRNSKDRICLKV
jgi:tRNA G18 (ribose-2'-O)-methylase SpoU